MIINPSANTMAPRRVSCRKFVLGRRASGRVQALALPGGKRLWQEVAKVLAVAVVFLVVPSFFITASITRITGEIEEMALLRSDIFNASIALRAQKAKVFSAEMVAVSAEKELSIYPPGPGQYHQIYKF